MLGHIVERRKLSFEESYELFNMLIKEDKLRVAAYLASLQTKGYEAEELAGFARAMRDKAIKINLGEVCDTCGTGGDGAFTINVSTACALMLSNFKTVAKHGNIAVTSRSGSANVLEALGISYKLNPNQAKILADKTNFTFLFAPLYHPALRRIMPVRKALQIKTVFNILGPLCNPAEPKYQIIGVSSEELVRKVAEALELLEVERAIVLHGNGIDEANPNGETLIAEIDGGIDYYTLTPEDLGINRVRILRCLSAKESAERIKAVFRGEGLEEDRNFILLNASLALYSTGFDDLTGCVDAVRNCINSMDGKLEEIACVSRSLTT